MSFYLRTLGRQSSLQRLNGAFVLVEAYLENSTCCVQNGIMISKPSITPSTVEILNKVVSYQKNTWSAFSKEMTISEVLQEIQSDIHKSQVQNLRSLLQQNKRDEYNSHKRTLAAVTFCGTFDGERKKSNIKNYNALIVIDIDKLDSAEISRIKDCFENEPLVFAFWESPSKEGLKGLVSICYQFELTSANLDNAHKGAFRKIASYFKVNYNIELDISGSDTTRLCFFSYDPLLRIKNEFVEYEIAESDLLTLVVSKNKSNDVEFKISSNKDALNNPSNRNAPSDRYTIAAIIRFLEKKNTSITNSYEEWYKVSMAIANTFTYEVGEKYFLKLSSLDSSKFDETECKNFLTSCYESRSGAIKFSTIVYFANKKGYLTKKQRERGSEVVDKTLS